MKNKKKIEKIIKKKKLTTNKIFDFCIGRICIIS